MDIIARILSLDEEQIEASWTELKQRIYQHFGQEGSIETLLFLIGVQSAGKGYQPRLKKEKKQALVMEGTCYAFETLGLYKRNGADANGKPRWQPIVPPSGPLSLEQQEKVLRVAIICYFNGIWPELQSLDIL